MSRDKIEEFLVDFSFWCLCGSEECQRFKNYERSRQALEVYITDLERLAKIELLENLNDVGEINHSVYDYRMEDLELKEQTNE